MATIGKEIAEVWYEGGPDDGEKWSRIQGLSRMIDTMTEKELERVTAQCDALAAACRGMVEQCPVCGDGEGTWRVEGVIFPCPYCHSARAALGLVTAGQEAT